MVSAELWPHQKTMGVSNLEYQCIKVELLYLYRAFIFLPSIFFFPFLSSRPLPSSFLLPFLSLHFHNTVANQRQIPQNLVY